MLSSWRMYEMHLALFLKAGCDKVSLALVTIEFDHKKNEKEKNQSKRKRSNEHKCRSK
jgi:hypothetical protein